jgi:hypothetical protein
MIYNKEVPRKKGNDLARRGNNISLLEYESKWTPYVALLMQEEV